MLIEVAWSVSISFVTLLGFYEYWSSNTLSSIWSCFLILSPLLLSLGSLSGDRDSSSIVKEGSKSVYMA